MPSTVRCLKLPPAVLLIGALWLSGCARVGSEAGVPCPPVVEYSAAEQARAAAEVGELADGAEIVRMLSDCAVMRDQARACQ